jgi:hypothetical protein
MNQFVQKVSLILKKIAQSGHNLSCRSPKIGPIAENIDHNIDPQG